MLTLQDKLALTLTSAGSMRKLAQAMGITHQKLGRWLREGQPANIDPETGYLISGAGVKAIPPDYAPIINFVFGLHKMAAREQSRADGLPYLTHTPVYMERAMMRSGIKGDRVISANTEFIRDALRRDILEAAQQSNAFHNASVRSTVNFVIYSKRLAQEIKTTEGRTVPVSVLTKNLMRNFLAGPRGQPARILPEDKTLTIFTPYANMAGSVPLSAAMQRSAVGKIEARLSQKHSPAAIHFADMYLFQTLPQRRNEKPQKPKPRRPAPRKAQSTRIRARRAKK